MDSQITIDDLKKSIMLYPGHVESYKQLGNAYFNISSFSESFKSYEQVSKLNPMDKDSYFFKSVILLYDSKLEEALKEIDKCIKLDPLFGHSKYHKAKIQFFNSDLHGMQKTLEELKQVSIDLHNKFLSEFL